MSIAIIDKHVYPLTDWFEDVQPVHPGVYQRDIEGTILFSYWDGEEWYVLGRSPERALMHFTDQGIVSSYQLTDHTHRWRGLTRVAVGTLERVV